MYLHSNSTGLYISYKFCSDLPMLLVQGKEFTEFELAVLVLTVASISANIAIFQQLQGNYSIRYELLRSRPLRKWRGLRKLIVALYWLNLLLPSILLVALFIEILTRGLIGNAFVVLVNGLLVLCMSSFTNVQTFYYKLLAVLLAVVASQLTVMFLLKFDLQYFYVCTSCVFFSLNGVLVSLTVWAREQTYWQLSMVFDKMKDRIRQVNRLWVGDEDAHPPTKPVHPKMFDGGLYGWLSRSPSSLVSYLLYTASLIVLAIYSYLIWWERKNYLGAIAAGAILTLDIVVFFMSSLSEKTREPRTINFMIFMTRFFLFIFGEDFWFGGYCALYVLVGGFIGNLIIEKRFPKTHNPEKRETVNALKTPEFMLILMSLEMAAMILGIYFSDSRLTSDFIEIGTTRWPFWLFGIVAILVNFVVVFYMASLRILFRQMNKIKSTVTYYFGAPFLTEYHVFVLITYSLLALLGVYFYLGLQSLLGLLIFLFVPLLYMCIAGMAVCWQKNDFYILCDIDQYNKNKRKEFEAQQNTKRLLEEESRGRRGKKRHSIAKNTLLKLLQPKQDSRVRVPDDKLDEHSQHQLLAIEEEKTEHRESARENSNNVEVYPMDIAETGYKQLVNWRNQQFEIGFPRLLGYITVNDRLLLGYMLAFLLLLAGFSVATKVLVNSWLGLYITICLVSYIFQMSYYRCCKTHHDIQPQEIVGIVGGYLLGIVYWAINWQVPEGAISWAVAMILILANLLIQTLQKKLPKLLYALQITQILLCLVFICVIVNFNLPTAYLALAGALIFYFLAGVAAYYIYKRNNDSAPKWLVYTIVGIVFLSIISVMVVGFASDTVSDIVGFTVTMLSFSGIGMGLAAYQFYKKLVGRYEVPIVYSAYGLPVYKFDSTTETLKKNEAFVYLHFVSLVWIALYSELVFLFFANDTHIGIITLCVFEVIGYYSVGQMLTNNYHTIGKSKQLLQDNPRIYLDSFDLVKNKYMQEETQGKSSGDLAEELSELEKRVEADNSDELYDEILHIHDRIVIDQSEQQRFLFFWMVLIEFRLYSDQKNEMLKVIYMVKQIQEELEAAGIVFSSLGLEGSLQTRYDRLKSEINSLPPEKYLYYEHLVEKQWEKKKAKDEADKLLHQQEEEENRKKEEQLQKKLSQNTSGEQKKDKIIQFKRLLKSVRKGRFEDPDFPEDVDLYDHLQSFGERKKLIKGDVNASDVRQGALGDCYLISALGVLGHHWVCRALGMEHELNGHSHPQEWQNCKGALMVRFWKFSQQIYVIIDDRLPVDGSGNIIFGRSEDQQEIWVSVIQKAYAKLYGGYGMIKGGKCHLAMSELTGGFPSEIILKDYERNLNGAWNQLISAYNNKYLLAAGSPGGRGKDTTSSKRGIVQGHAYSIVEVRQVEDNRLLKLKNPHGSAGKEWRGDWSDDSPQMTNRIMGLLGHSKTNDGMFWMALEDFVIEFKSLYICRIFSENWKYLALKGQWTEQNSYGRPTLKSIELNPQFGIKVYSKCTVFISLTQERQDLIYGINFIGLRVQRNQGKRMYSNDISTDNLCSVSRPTINSIVVSTQVNLEADSYPYVFTLMIYTQDKGETGPYTVEFYSSEPNTQIIDDPQFHRP